MTQPERIGERATLYHGDCLAVMRAMAERGETVQAIVTDPPYGLEFMGREWDTFKTGRSAKYSKGGDLNVENIAARSGKGGAGPSYVNRPARRCAKCGKQAWSGSPCVCADPEWTIDNSPLIAFQSFMTEWARLAFALLPPGGHLVAFGGTRTWHRMACAIEDAGFEIRDTLMWVYASGFPKSHDVSKGIDRAAGATREVVGFDADKSQRFASGLETQNPGWDRPRMHEADAVQRRGAITAPATPEAARWAGWGTALKPAVEPIVLARKPLGGTVAQCVLAHGTGALNIDGCRIPTSETDKATINAKHAGMDPATYERPVGVSLNLSTRPMPLLQAAAHPAGRWPANLVHDGSAEVEAAFAAFGESTSTTQSRHNHASIGYGGSDVAFTTHGYADTGSASRFFFSAKADTDDRAGSRHPTVKPVALMRWLVRLVCPPGGTVLDPFSGTGTTGEAAIREGFGAVLIEQDAEHCADIRRRLARAWGGDLPLALPAPQPEPSAQSDLFGEALP
jgi:DNA modification methylase